MSYIYITKSPLFSFSIHMKYMKCVHYMQYDINEFTPIYIQIHEFLVPINITYKDTHPPSTHLS